MRQQLSGKGDIDGIISHAQPFACGTVFYFHTDGVNRYHKYKQHQYTWCKCVTQIYGVIQPRIVQRMCIDDDGLQECHSLVFRSTFGIQTGACCGSRCQLAHHLHIFVKQRTGDKQRVVGIERYGRLSLRLRLGSGTFRNVVESVDFSFLHGGTCFVDSRIMGYDGGLLKCIQVSHQLA